MIQTSATKVILNCMARSPVGPVTDWVFQHCSPSLPIAPLYTSTHRSVRAFHVKNSKVSHVTAPGSLCGFFDSLGNPRLFSKCEKAVIKYEYWVPPLRSIAWLPSELIGARFRIRQAHRFYSKRRALCDELSLQPRSADFGDGNASLNVKLG